MSRIPEVSVQWPCCGDVPSEQLLLAWFMGQAGLSSESSGAKFCFTFYGDGSGYILISKPEGKWQECRQTAFWGLCILRAKLDSSDLKLGFEKEFVSKILSSLLFVLRRILETRFNYLLWVNVNLVGRVYLMMNEMAAPSET